MNKKYQIPLVVKNIKDGIHVSQRGELVALADVIINIKCNETDIPVCVPVTINITN